MTDAPSHRPPPPPGMTNREAARAATAVVAEMATNSNMMSLKGGEPTTLVEIGRSLGLAWKAFYEAATKDG